MTRWIGVHVHHQDDLTRLLVDGVAPVLADLAGRGLVRRWFFLRYWDGGNHLRVRVQPTAGEAETTGPVVAGIERYLRRRPSARLFDDADYLGVATRLAAAEGLSDFSRTLVPNDTVQLVEYVPETHRYGTGAALRAVEQHFVESSAIALSLVASGCPASRVHTVALAALLVTGADGGLVTHPVRDPLPLTDAALDLARRVRWAAGADVVARWAASVADLRRALGPGEHTARVIDTCAHLFCNRAGVALPHESRLRDLAGRALAATEETSWAG